MLFFFNWGKVAGSDTMWRAIFQRGRVFIYVHLLSRAPGLLPLQNLLVQKAVYLAGEVSTRSLGQLDHKIVSIYPNIFNCTCVCMYMYVHAYTLRSLQSVFVPDLPNSP